MSKETEKLMVRAAELEREVALIPAKIEALIIKDDASLVVANNETKNIRAIRKEVAEFFDPNIGRLHTAHKEAVAQKKKFDDPLAAAEKLNKGKIARYYHELEQQALEAERAAYKAKQEAEEKAQALAAAGEAKKAEEFLSQYQNEPLPAVVTPKLEGTYIVKLPKFRLLNLDSVPREYLMLDQVKVMAAVKAAKGLITIPGIEIYFEDSVRMKQ